MTATEPGTCDSLTSQDASSAATDAVSVGSAIGGEGGDADAGIGADTGNDSDLEVHAGDDALADADLADLDLDPNLPFAVRLSGRRSQLGSYSTL